MINKIYPLLLLISCFVTSLLLGTDCAELIFNFSTITFITFMYAFIVWITLVITITKG